MAEDFVIVEMQTGDVFRYYRHNVCLYVEERTELELTGLPCALRIGEGAAGCQDAQAHLQHVVLADGAHLALGKRHLVELLGVLQVLLRDAHLLAGYQEVEEEADGLHRHLLRLGQETRLGLAIAQRLYAAVPFQTVDAENGLREGERDGQ